MHDWCDEICLHWALIEVYSKGSLSESSNCLYMNERKSNQSIIWKVDALYIIYGTDLSVVGYRSWITGPNVSLQNQESDDDNSKHLV